MDDEVSDEVGSFVEATASIAVTTLAHGLDKLSRQTGVNTINVDSGV